MNPAFSFPVPHDTLVAASDKIYIIQNILSVFNPYGYAIQRFELQNYIPFSATSVIERTPQHPRDVILKFVDPLGIILCMKGTETHLYCKLLQQPPFDVVEHCRSRIIPPVVAAIQLDSGFKPDLFRYPVYHTDAKFLYNRIIKFAGMLKSCC